MCCRGVRENVLKATARKMSKQDHFCASPIVARTLRPGDDHDGARHRILPQAHGEHGGTAGGPLKICIAQHNSLLLPPLYVLRLSTHKRLSFKTAFRSRIYSAAIGCDAGLLRLSIFVYHGMSGMAGYSGALR